MKFKSASQEWKNLIFSSSLTDDQLKRRLQRIYGVFFPKFAEILINPHCPNNCKHCFFPCNYHEHNKALGTKYWEKILSTLYKKLGFRHFIFSGRGLNNNLLYLVRYLKKNFGDVKVGIVADGPAIKKYYDGLCNTKLDHLDISIDGLERTHDSQRNYKGSFNITVEQIKKLLSWDGPVKKGNIGKLSILSTLTTLNKDEILPMITYFNKNFGIKNFFITPIAIYKDYGPKKSLKPSFKETARFMRETIRFFPKLIDSYVAFNIYEDEFPKYLKSKNQQVYNWLKPKNDLFEFSLNKGDNEFHLFWYPLAINGCREFIINSDGRILPGFVQGMGEIPDKYSFGNALEIKGNKKEFFKSLTKKPAFNLYIDWLKRSRDC